MLGFRDIDDACVSGWTLCCSELLGSKFLGSKFLGSKFLESDLLGSKFLACSEGSFGGCRDASRSEGWRPGVNALLSIRGVAGWFVVGVLVSFEGAPGGLLIN